MPIEFQKSKNTTPYKFDMTTQMKFGGVRGQLKIGAEMYICT